MLIMRMIVVNCLIESWIARDHNNRADDIDDRKKEIILQFPTMLCIVNSRRNNSRKGINCS